jgi:hypothetical protein
MISRTKTIRIAVVCLLAGFSASGCAAATQADVDEAELQAELAEQDEVASTEQALLSGGWNQRGFSCNGNSCECSKAIENDCEDMTAVCTDATVDAVIACINGWATTHCVCTKSTGLVRPTGALPTLQYTTSATFNTAAIAR